MQWQESSSAQDLAEKTDRPVVRFLIEGAKRILQLYECLM